MDQLNQEVAAREREYAEKQRLMKQEEDNAKKQEKLKQDAEKADETFSILMGDKVAPRREFIETNAKYVQNLDI